MGQKMTTSGSDHGPADPLLLSKFLAENRVGEVEGASRVKLSGVDVESYSGYITVHPEHEANLFFWFFPATKVKQVEAPLVLYLNGGPGNSSMIGLFEEIGPLRIDKNLKVHKAAVTWTDNFNVLFVDNPVFTGFSYAKPGHESKNLRAITENLYSFLTQFLRLYPKYKDCDLYIGGISYAGKYVPALASRIHSEMENDDDDDDDDDEADKPVINLRGIFTTSGFFDPYQMFHTYPHYLETMGLISEKKARALAEKLAYALDKHRLLGKYEEAVMDLMDLVFMQMHKTLGYESLDSVLTTKNYNWHFPAYLNKPEVQRAIHARACKFEFGQESMIVHMAEDFLKGVSAELKTTMENYKVLMVSGQMDIVVSVPMTESFLHDFRWSGMSRYLAANKAIWRDKDGEVAGYVTEVKNLTRVVMRNAGHRPALDQPAWTLDMMTKFVNDESFVH